MDYLERLCRFVADTRWEDIPQQVRDRTCAIVLDTLPVMAWGMRTPQLKSFAAKQMEFGSPGACWVIGLEKTTNRIDAAMLNGIAGAWLDFDEGNFLANGHPGIQVIPAALAVAQERGLSGREFLTAVALSYEVVARIGMATQIKLIINPHGTFGVVGAALATARLLHLPVSEYRNLASLAASSCVATNRHTMLDGATVRNWYAGHSGYMGQMAVRLVESGFTGPSDGVNTTFSLVLGDGFQGEVAVQDLGQRWLLTEGYLKLYPTARYVHSAIDALHDLQAKASRPIAPEEVADISVHAYRLAAYLSTQRPTVWFGARFSIPFALATLMVGGRLGLEAFGDEAVNDPRIVNLASKIRVEEEPTFSAAYPAQQRVDLTLTTVGGKKFHGQCTITSGEPDRPHTDASLLRKFNDLATPLWGEPAASALRNAVLNLHACPDVSKLLPFVP
jgi:2-methylcitrate dehydratase PrpD